MSKKRYVVELTDEERTSLTGIVNKGRVAALKRRHAQVLLKVDEGEHGPGWPDQQVAEALDLPPNTVRGIRQRCVEEGLESALARRKQRNRGSRPPKLDGAQEARMIALACGPPPEGRAGWTVRLLADKIVELGIVNEPISFQTVAQRLKKTGFSLIGRSTG